MHSKERYIKRVSKIAGFLILLGMVVGIFSIVPSVESEHFLEELYPNRNQVLIGAVFQFLLVPIYISFSLVLYQVLRDYDKTLSIGFVGLRMMAGVFQFIGMILLPLFIFLSQEYLTSTTSNQVYYETTGEILKLFRDLTNHLGVMVTTGLGNVLLYIIFLRGKHIPRLLSIWGLGGNVLIILVSFFILFQFIEVVSKEYVIITIPLVIQEVVLAIWLIVKGLKSPKKKFPMGNKNEGNIQIIIKPRNQYILANQKKII